MSNDKTTTLTRRQFLSRGATAAGAAALPCLIPASALGRGGAVAPSERIVMGGIGLGGRGSYDLGWMLTERDVQWAAICDVRKGRREAAKNVVDSKYGNKDCAVYGDLRQLLAERTDVDAVLIATGDRWHALASILAMRAGKDVYCEKPACLTMAQGQMVVETARASGAEAEFALTAGYPPVVNEERSTAFARDALIDILGTDRVVEIKDPVMGGEDFAYYLKKIPGTFIRIGVGDRPPLHNSSYDFNDEAIPFGIRIMAGIAVRFLGKGLPIV